MSRPGSGSAAATSNTKQASNASDETVTVHRRVLGVRDGVTPSDGKVDPAAAWIDRCILLNTHVP